jgi:hypothetical protein
VVTELGLEVSHDDGATWHAVPILRVGNHGLALVQHPPRPGAVALRARATDGDGNSVRQSVIGAYHIR